MNQPVVQTLVKDFIDGRFILYWQDEEGNRVSGYYPSEQQAMEWWLKFEFSKWTATERRKTLFDRRRNVQQRLDTWNRLRFGSSAPDGRRSTDTVKINIVDRSRVSMLQFYARNPHLVDDPDE